MASPTLDYRGLRQRMVDHQIRPSEITDHDLITAILAVPRELFVPEAEKPFSYSDRELKLRATSGDRRMIDPVQLARMIQALAINPQSKVMVVGCGTGYSAAILNQLAGSVVAVDEDEQLVRIAGENLVALVANRVRLVRAPLTEGFPGESPYDAILVEGAVEVLPDKLLEQLRPGGLLAAIVREKGISRAMLYERFGAGSTKWPQFEAWATLLPGFQGKHEFVF